MQNFYEISMDFGSSMTGPSKGTTLRPAGAIVCLRGRRWPRCKSPKSVSRLDGFEGWLPLTGEIFLEFFSCEDFHG